MRSATKKSPPATLPIVAIASARSFNLGCNGVFSELLGKAARHSLVRGRKYEEEQWMNPS